MSDDAAISRSSGGIVSRSGERSAHRPADDLPALMRGWRRRWASGIAVATTAHDGALRGITLTAVMSVSLEPPVLAVSLVADGEFLAVLREAGRCVVHILDRDQDFLAERFAGRAPVPDSAFGGVPHELIEELPVLRGALAWAIGDVERVDPFGDHALVVLRIARGEIGGDTDDPLLSYEGRYRGLEAS
jgi:flavin reductase (DIM6/NTAB) family NADH-FMN oxidoreductase RutF